MGEDKGREISEGEEFEIGSEVKELKERRDREDRKIWKR